MSTACFHLLNRSERAWLDAIAAGALLPWRQRWFRAPASSTSTPSTLEAVCQAAEACAQDLFDAGSGWLSLHADGDWRIAIPAPPFLLDELGAALILPEGAPARRRTRPSPLLRGVARAALTDMLRTLLAAMPGQGAATDAVAGEEAPPAHCRRPGGGAVVIELMIGGFGCRVTISGEVIVPALATRQDVARLRGGLTSRMDCLAPLRLSPRLVAGEAELTISELQTMMAGDVITLDAAVEQPFALRNAAGIRLCGGFLGLRDGRKCIRLTR